MPDSALGAGLAQDRSTFCNGLCVCVCVCVCFFFFFVVCFFFYFFPEGGREGGGGEGLEFRAQGFGFREVLICWVCMFWGLAFWGPLLKGLLALYLRSMG